jgi:hypothetical protein
MAINPNTDFTAGAILTAAQQNRFPRGIMARGVQTTSQFGIGAETQVVASGTFTAVANRFYKITFILPYTYKTTTGLVKARIRKTNTTGTIYQEYNITRVNDQIWAHTVEVVTTLDAGSIEVVGTLVVSAGTINNEPAATYPCQIIVEDIGPA